MTTSSQMSPYQFDMSSMMSSMFTMIFMVLVVQVMLSVVAEPKAPELPPGYMPIPGARPIPKEQVERVRREARRAPTGERVVGTGMTTTEIESKKAALEDIGRTIAEQAGEGVEFVRLDEGWQPRFSLPRFWFRDAEGNEIIATDLPELVWKLGVTGR